MARRPNYAFERNARAKAKAEKREAKRQAKLVANVTNQSGEPEPESGDVKRPDGVASEDSPVQAGNGQPDDA